MVDMGVWEQAEIALRELLDPDEAVDALLLLKEKGFILAHQDGNWRESDAVKEARALVVHFDGGIVDHGEGEWFRLLKAVLEERDFIGEWLQRLLDESTVA